MAFMRGSFDHEPFKSKAETDLRDMYQVGKNKGELKIMPMTDIYIVLHPFHGEVNEGDYPKEELFVCRPDFHWHIGTFFITQFLDGPPHRKARIERRDAKITALLEKSGYIVDRRPFELMTVRLRKEIYEETCDLVNGYCEKWGKMNGGKNYG